MVTKPWSLKYMSGTKTLLKKDVSAILSELKL